MAKKKVKPITRDKGLTSRPPVVAVLGHVDHGKTTLLDKIRQTNVVASEAGGITQNIGAYQVESKKKKITFIDTPGHAAFSQMRSRGAKVADLVVLVIAADEGVKPQTLESLKHIKSAKVIYLVALAKTDLPNINIERVKKEISSQGIALEKYGGDVVCVPVSGKTGKGIEDLLEMILVLAEMAELKGSPDAPLEAVVIESKLDSRKGTLATILVRNGSLKVGEEVIVDNKVSKIRAMFNEWGKPVALAGPSTPVEILGFKEAPTVGAPVIHAQGATPVSLEEERKKRTIKEAEAEKLKIILKADTAGTLEAITSSLPEEVQVIYSDVGDVKESEVLLADTTRAEIMAFNVKTPGSVKKLAETEKIKMTHHKIIYKLLEEIEKKVLKMLKPTIDEEVLGKAEVLEEFEIDKERVAGCRVIEGEMKKTDRFHLLRKEEILGDCRIKSMRTGKKDVERTKKGEEFGAILSPVLDFDIGDMLVSFRKVEES